MLRFINILVSFVSSKSSLYINADKPIGNSRVCHDLFSKLPQTVVVIPTYSRINGRKNINKGLQRLSLGNNSQPNISLNCNFDICKLCINNNNTYTQCPDRKLTIMSTYYVMGIRKRKIQIYNKHPDHKKITTPHIRYITRDQHYVSRTRNYVLRKSLTK